MTAETAHSWRFTDKQDLAPLLHKRRWKWRLTPYPHVVATDVFVPDVYRRLTQDFQAFLDSKQVALYNDKHDFLGISLIAGRCGALEVFLSEAWYSLFTDLFGCTSVGYLTAGLHRHLPGSRNGFPHNDIHPENLATTTVPGEVTCYGSHTRSTETMVRAIAILYYLNNGPWHPGDGGETGLFRHWSDSVSNPASRVPPADNTLFAFECSPYSYHAFLSNRRCRDSVIVFVYRTLDDFLALWGFDGVRQYAETGVHDV